MTDHHDSPAVRHSVSVFVRLLRLYPAAFRENYGQEMKSAFRDAARSAWQDNSAHGLAALWARTMPDIFLSAGRERMEAGNLSLFWRRALALVADRGITFTIFFFAGMVGMLPGFDGLGAGNANLWTWPGESNAFLVLGYQFIFGLPSVAWAVIIAAWLVFQMVVRGRTPGMEACGISLVDAGGAPPNWRRVLLWHAASYVSGTLLGLGYLWAVIDSDGRTWHDIAAGVRVRVRSGAKAETTSP